MKRINVGIIGKNFGLKVIYNAIKNNKSFNVIAFSFRKNLKDNSLPKNIKIYKDWKKLVSDKKIDTIVISSPPKTHSDIIKFAIKRKKNIFCEKPVTTSFKEISEISKILKKKTIIHMVNYEFPNIEAFTLFKRKYLKSINIKKINVDWFIKIKKNKRANWKDSHNFGGGVFFNYICHVLYYLENLFGQLTIVDTKLIKDKRNFLSKFNFLIKKKKIKILFNFKIINNNKTKPFHRIKIYSNKGIYILQTKMTTLHDQFYLKKNNKIVFSPDKINYDFRLKPTYINLMKFKNYILKKRIANPNFNKALRVHYLIKKLKSLNK